MKPNAFKEFGDFPAQLLHYAVRALIWVDRRVSRGENGLALIACLDECLQKFQFLRGQDWLPNVLFSG